MLMFYFRLLLHWWVDPLHPHPLPLRAHHHRHPEKGTRCDGFQHTRLCIDEASLVFNLKLTSFILVDSNVVFLSHSTLELVLCCCLSLKWSELEIIFLAWQSVPSKAWNIFLGHYTNFCHCGFLYPRHNIEAYMMYLNLRVQSPV